MYFGLSSTSPASRCAVACGLLLLWRRFGGSLGSGGRDASGPLAHREGDGSPLRRRVVCRRPRDDIEEMALDPVQREVVRNLDDELAVAQRLRPSLTEPGVVRRVGEGVPQPAGDGIPEIVGSCLGWVLQPSSRFIGAVGKGRAYHHREAVSTSLIPRLWMKIRPVLQGIFVLPHQLSTGVEDESLRCSKRQRRSPRSSDFGTGPSEARLWKTSAGSGPSILAALRSADRLHTT